MKIEKLFPPNFEKLKLAFPEYEKYKPIFCYGDTIYNPFNIEITPDLDIHEQVHSQQQGNDVEGWWNRYIQDEKFRLEQEVAAYGHQYKFLKERIPKRFYIYGLETMAMALSGEMYGNLVTYGQAESRIRNYAKNL